MSRFYVPEDNVKGDRIMTEGDEAHHIIDVMRLKKGDTLLVFDGTGRQYKGVLTSIDKEAKRAEIKIVEECGDRVGLPVDVTLAQAIPKRNKMEYLLQKATELGVNTIIPVVSDRTIVRPDAASSGRKTERWRKIAVAAAKQCGRYDVPGIGEAVQYNELAERFGLFDLVIFACFSEDAVPLKKITKQLPCGKILIVIGPEGGFSPSEISAAKISGCALVSLGRSVLKSDTAGLFVLSVLNYELT